MQFIVCNKQLGESFTLSTKYIFQTYHGENKLLYNEIFCVYVAVLINDVCLADKHKMSII